MSTLSCLICHTPNVRLLFQLERFGKTFSIFYCKDCRFGFQNPIPSANEIAEYYEKNYYGGTASSSYHYVNELATHKSRIPHYEGILQSVKRFSEKGNLLDIGCAFGLFVYVAQKRGWKAEGWDVSRYAVETGRKVLGVSLRVESMDRIHDVPGLYDVVNMSELLEHLPDPQIAFSVAHALLKKGGLLRVQTSNIASLYAKWKGKNWIYLLPVHVCYFSPLAIRKLADKFGFKVVKMFAGDDIPLRKHLESYRWTFGWEEPLLLKIARLVLRRLKLGPWSLGGGAVYYLRKR